MLAANIPVKVINKTVNHMLYLLIIISVFLIIGIVISIIIFSKSISKPLIIGVDFAREIASGNLDKSIDLKRVMK